MIYRSNTMTACPANLVRALLASALAMSASVHAQTAAPFTSTTGAAATTGEDPVAALGRYLRVLATFPRNLDALTGAGKAALAVGDANAAISFFARAEEISPRDGRIKAGLASALVQTEQPRTALKLFGEAVALGTPEAEIAGDRGLAYDLRGETKRAQQDYMQSLRWRPDDEITRRLAVSQAISGDRNTALTTLDPLLRKQDRPAWRVRAFVLALTGDGSGAEEAAMVSMTRPQAQALLPYFGKLAALRPGEKAAAVHLGQFPSNSGTSRPYAAEEAQSDPVRTPAPAATARSDAGLIPSGAAFGDRRVQSSFAAAPTPSNQGWNRQAASRSTSAYPASAQAGSGPTDAAPARGIGQQQAATATTPAMPAVPTSTAPLRSAALPVLMARGTPMAPAVATPVPAVPSPSPAASSPAYAAAPRPALGSNSAVGPGFSSESFTPVTPPTARAGFATATTSPAELALAAPAATPTPTLVRTAEPATERIAVAPLPAPQPPVEQSTLATPAPLTRTLPAEKVAVRAEIRPTPTPTPMARPTAKAAGNPREKATETKGAVEERTVRIAAAAGLESKGRDGKAADPKSRGKKTDPDAEVKAKAKPSARDEKVAAKDKTGKPKEDPKQAKTKEAAKEKADKADKAAGGERYWVQVASGANKSDLGKAWEKTRLSAPKLLSGRSTYTAPWKQSNRLLVGPFKSEAEAQGFVNQLGKAGMGGIQFTSRGGSRVEPLATK